MISNAAFNTQLNPIVNFQHKTDTTQNDFSELLTAKSLLNYDKMTEWAKGLWSKTVVHEIDSSEINGLHRKDFPKALLFNKNMTLEQLKKYSPTYPEPKSNWDPRAFNAGRKACKQNGVSILVSPQAVDRMNNDEKFYNYVMRQLEEKLYPSIQESMVGLPRVWTSGNFEYTSTDCSIIIEINDNGYVDGEVMGCGTCRRISDDENEENLKEKEFTGTKKLDEDKEDFHINHYHSFDQSLDQNLNITTPKFEYLYNFLGSFNFEALSEMTEFSKKYKG